MNETIVSRSDAERLAERISNYWSLAGHPHVRAWVEAVRLKRDIVWVVRSNLIRGLPP